MVWTFATKNKIRVSVLLCAVVAVVILTNFGERNNATKINNAVTSIYEDRLVVEGYIFELSQHLNSLEVSSENMFPSKDNRNAVTAHLLAVSKINDLYAKTELTTDEHYHFEEFRMLCNRIANNFKVGNTVDITSSFATADKILQKLSIIQLEKAREHMDDVNSLTSYSTIISHLELGILIVISLVIQVLLLSSKTLVSLFEYNKASLN
jgi:hypothetical protein